MYVAYGCTVAAPAATRITSFLVALYTMAKRGSKRVVCVIVDVFSAAFKYAEK